MNKTILALAALALAGCAETPSQSRGLSILAAARADVGRANFTRQRGPWCAAAMRVWTRRAGVRPLESDAAVAWLKWGHASPPVPGAVAVWRHHIGIVESVHGATLTVLSGNHGHRVGHGQYALRGVVGFRAP